MRAMLTTYLRCEKATGLYRINCQPKHLNLPQTDRMAAFQLNAHLVSYIDKVLDAGLSLAQDPHELLKLRFAHWCISHLFLPLWTCR